MKTYQLYINGQYVDPANGEWPGSPPVATPAEGA